MAAANGVNVRDTRRYWVWVTGPDYYLEVDGSERADLDPGRGYEPGGWWTCHRDTEEGDLVLLYRSQRKRDLAYLIETRSDAYSLLDDDYASEQGWDYGCDYEVIERFRRPVSLTEMRADPALEDRGALRANFQRRVYAIPPDTWNHLLDRLSDDRTKSERRRQGAAKRYALERDIEDRLAADLGPFRRHGLTLELRARQHVCRRGGRADLVCFDTGAKGYVVIELKRGLVSRNAVAQLLSYRSSIAEEFSTRRPPIGILVGDRLDNEAAGMIADDDRLNSSRWLTSRSAHSPADDQFGRGGNARPRHGELVRNARGSQLPDRQWIDSDARKPKRAEPPPVQQTDVRPPDTFRLIGVSPGELHVL